MASGIVYPGQVVPIDVSVKTKIGQGLVQERNVVVSSKCGQLQEDSGGSATMLWVMNSQRVYFPTVEDLVLGVVVEKHGDNYKVDIGSSQPAVLGAMAFEGATKRNKPNVAVGSLMYCRVLVADKDMETELTCTSPHFKKDWVTGESLFGELSGGYALDCSLDLARRLLAEDAEVLQSLGKHLPYELAVGVNGKVWINSGSPLHTILISNAILNSRHLTDAEVKSMVGQLVQNYV
jgi:exosome complex component RRP40